MIKLPNKLKLIGLDEITSYQLGGAINMNEEKKKELFPYFAYVYSQKLNPDKYGAATSIEEWTALIQDNPEDVNIITEAAGQLSNDDWETLAQQYEEAQASEKGGLTKEPQLAAKGAKLKKLNSVKKAILIKKKLTETVADTVSNPSLTQVKGGEVKKKVIPKGKKKKCTCGCDLILSKAKGGKVIETCSCKCGGKLKKKPVEKKQEGGKTADSTKIYKEKMENAIAKGERYNKLAQASKLADPKIAESISKEVQTSGNNMIRQANKGKPGYDKNGFPIKKKK